MRLPTGRAIRTIRPTSGPRSALLGLVAAAALAVVTAGCSKPADRSEVVTFTDQHGRVCTGAVTVDGEDGGREVSALDCEYPPKGRAPGHTGYRPLP